MAKIWDCFMFGGELDLLELRLRELGDVVDHFVICEASMTHSGLPKPLYYSENRERFGRWDGKIVHVVAELDPNAAHAWRREGQQRRFIKNLLRERAHPDDAIVMGDVDEFIDRDALAALAAGCKATVSLGMAHAIFYANWWMPKPWGAPPVFGRGSQLDEGLMKNILGEDHDDWDGFRQRIVDGVGVHVSYLGGPDAVRKKFAGHPDTYLNTPRYLRPGYLERCIEHGVHFEGRQLLRRLRLDELPPVLQRAHAIAPHLFDFSPAPRAAAAHALCGYAWLRRSPRFPQRTVDWLDAHPDVVTKGSGAPLFRALDGALQFRRRVWDRPEMPYFLALESPLRNRRFLRKRTQLLEPIHLSLEEALETGGTPSADPDRAR